MLAVIPVRDGALPAGAAEVAAEVSTGTGGRVLLVGSGTAGVDTTGLGPDVLAVELGAYAPAAWAARLRPLLIEDAVVVLPSSPDGRDLAPRLAHVLGRPLYAGAVEVTPDQVTVSRGAGLELHAFRPDHGFVATLQPGVRDPLMGPDATTAADVVDVTDRAAPIGSRLTRDADITAVLPPDVATMDLGEAPRILGGGAGLDAAERFAQLARIAADLDAAMGATRVITDRNWVGHERQIGTTGVVVDPSLYLAFGISGAVQHTSGLGHPDHVVSVNTDPHCPMMQMADLAVVADANAVLDELESLLDERGAG
ncbi:MAG: mycofactocin-associated electron transfer flavoprotein alpha subunit [Ilumatobacteraceae bacterium]